MLISFVLDDCWHGFGTDIRQAFPSLVGRQALSCLFSAHIGAEERHWKGRLIPRLRVRGACSYCGLSLGSSFLGTAGAALGRHGDNSIGCAWVRTPSEGVPIMGQHPLFSTGAQARVSRPVKCRKENGVELFVFCVGRLVSSCLYPDPCFL